MGFVVIAGQMENAVYNVKDYLVFKFRPEDPRVLKRPVQRYENFPCRIKIETEDICRAVFFFIFFVKGLYLFIVQKNNF